MRKSVICIPIEWKKFFKSKLPLTGLLAFSLLPFAAGFFMFVLKDPELAENLGVISTKAQILGIASWSSYLDLLAQAISIGGLFVFGFSTAWIFGREYSDQTIKDLLALPIPRSVIVLSKFTVVFLWCCILSVAVFITSLIVGYFVELPGSSLNVLLQGIETFIISSLLTISLSTPVAFFASVGRGFLPPLTFIIIAVVFSQLIAAIGYGEFFPWSIPALASGITGVPILNPVSIVIVILMSLLGILATTAWWKYADQT